MYFIPRNNAIYNYIAHTDTKRRYCATLFVVFGAIGIGVYGVYMPLESHIALYKAEKMQLQKQHEEIAIAEKNNKNVSDLIDAHKKNLRGYEVAQDQRIEHCNARMQFIFDTIAQLGLTLNAYGSCKEKDKTWYVKDSSHCQITGTLEKLISFLKAIKDAQQMITLSHVSITRVKENIFQLSCDIGVISVNCCKGVS
jgi:Tfp pilus assembly protein PilO